MLKKGLSIRIFSTLVLSLLLSSAVLAEDLWVEENGKWYFYQMEEGAAEGSAAQEETAAATEGTETADGNTSEEAGETAAETVASASAPGEALAASESSETSETEAAADGRKRYTGWIQAEENGWYYIEDSLMMTGWCIVDGEFYYFGADGLMAHDSWVDGNLFYVGEDGKLLRDTTTPDGVKVNERGIRLRNGKPVVELNEKTARYVEILLANPGASIECTSPGQVIKEGSNGRQYYIFKLTVLYDRSGKMIYSGDGAFDLGAVIELKSGDGTTAFGASALYDYSSFTGKRVYMNPAGLITCISQRSAS